MNRYILYVRKSSEGEDRQVQSIDDQLRILRDFCERKGLTVVKEIKESASAKRPGNRVGYLQMVQLIQKGEVDGILCWHLNRLSRNPVESGELQWMIQEGSLRSILTPEKEYKPEDSVLFFKLDTGMAEQYSIDLSKVVRRGFQGKLERGEYPRRAPEGYINDTVEHVILPDPERFALIRWAWELLLSDTVSVNQIVARLNQRGYITRKSRKRGGGSLSTTAAHLMFSNVFYTGKMMHSGEMYQGNHEPMVTAEEFARAQEILHKKGFKKKSRHDFPYTGMITCAKCRKAITAELHCSRKKEKAYTYYHCTNYGVCKNRSVREEVIEKEISNYLRHVAIHPKFENMMRAWIEARYEQESSKEEYLMKSQHARVDEIQSEKSQLIKLSIKGMISDAEFKREQEALDNSLTSLKGELSKTEHSLTKARSRALEAVSFAVSAPFEFATASPLRKKEIARKLGVNFFLDNGKLVTELEPLLVPIYSYSIETVESSSDKEKTAPFSTVLSFGGTDRSVIETLLERIWQRSLVTM